MNEIKFNISDSVMQQPEKQYKYLIFFSMLCMILMICKSIFSYRLVELCNLTLQAGQLVAPLWFITSDIIAEVYGYKNAKKILMAGFICQIIFTLICTMLNHLPYPAFWDNKTSYENVFSDIWRISIASLIAFLISGIINIRLVTYWKALTHGKFFWLRSIGASGIGEAIYSILATLIIQYGKLSSSLIVSMILVSITLKLIYSVLLAIPANFVSYIVIKSEKISQNNYIPISNRD